MYNSMDVFPVSASKSTRLGEDTKKCENSWWSSSSSRASRVNAETPLDVSISRNTHHKKVDAIIVVVVVVVVSIRNAPLDDDDGMMMMINQSMEREREREKRYANVVTRFPSSLFVSLEY